MNDVDDYWKNLAERHLDANELAQARVCIIHHAELHPHDKRLLTRFQIMLALGHYESAHCIMETLCPLDKSSSAHPVLLLTHGKLYFAQNTSLW